ncbi:hypothetical protein FEK35_21880 [Nocardia cyriacigeorgica]|uniref:Mce-associated membrane protein n=1 Tax=Nocardia cyriacigeorgica TaxID=135487 RepID=A0A5R8P966_9NOCA|nr:hypothetical protein [Nocardia cyriacigeorgica]TLG03289.1 hypothetical protein FEK35_21880 [Nocardia cyriacigeorgica]
MPYPTFAGPQPPSPPREPGRRRIALISAAVAAVLMIGGAGVAIGVAIGDSPAAEQTQPTQTQPTQTERRAPDTRAAAQRAACDFAALMSTYDYRDLDSYQRAIDAGSTGRYKTDFNSAFPQVRELIVLTQMSSTSNDVQCSYQSGDDKRAEVSVHSEHTVTKAFEAPQTVRQELTVMMEQVDGRWLCSGMEPTQPK